LNLYQFLIAVKHPTGRTGIGLHRFYASRLNSVRSLSGKTITSMNDCTDTFHRIQQTELPASICE
jgi:hypothetical protein